MPKISTKLTQDKILLLEYFQDFLHHKKMQNCKESTLNTYISHFNYFLEFFEEEYKREMYLADFNEKVLTEHIDYLQTRHVKFGTHLHVPDWKKQIGALSPRTINDRMGRLQTFAQYLLQRGIMKDNPFLNVPKILQDNQQSDVLTKQELERLSKHIEEKAKTTKEFHHFRSLVLFHVLVDTMGRINMVLNLRESDFSYDDRTLVFRAESSKNRRTHVIPITLKTARLVRKLIDYNQGFYDRKVDENIFLALTGRRLTPDVWLKQLKKYAKEVGIGKRVYSHLIRKSSATIALQNGIGIEELRRMLTHSDFSTIMRYVELNSDNLKQAQAEYSVFAEVERTNRLFKRPNRIDKF
ncbi:tyrosine-type recombinase/integrase [Ectobacillus panaciterrae]|uniref:tyrosine-type recombinase/integrase n=1 Tax=Ectobacillus panaciterrae TaxID=363872 RepID=UPI000427EAFA|nr:site-specific integrase [Ectobacillus panaciterrae]